MGQKQYAERPYTRVYAAIDLDAIEENISAMKGNLAEKTSIMGVVKADGYGHGAVPVAKTISPYVTAYGVATIEEARNLQKHGIEKPILVLGVTHKSHNEELVNYGIRSTIFEEAQALALSKTAVKAGRQAYVHLAVDTGMNRIGMMPDEESAELVWQISRLPGICVEGIFTHFAKADEADKTSANRQLEKYLEFVRRLRDRGIRISVRHISNSAGILDMKEAGCDMVRAGISMYGMYPSDEVRREQVVLKPAMELKTCITYIKNIQPKAAVSYGGTFVADHPMRVATVPVGYGDGYPRNLSGKGRVLIQGKSARILGRVCMDQMMVDVTEIPEAAEDDEVTLIGRDKDQEITVEELAGLCNGFHYEIVCGIGKRVPRVYIKDGAVVGKKDYFDDIYEDFAG